MPTWVQVAWSLSSSFGWRRRVVLAWLAIESDPGCQAIRNLVFWCRRPRLFFQVRQRVAILRSGRDILGA
jgi:hypothetical protein